MFEYKKKRTHEGVPAWDIYYGERVVGLLTNFPYDGPVATVRISTKDDKGNVASLEREVKASTVTTCFQRATKAHQTLIEDMVNKCVPC